MVIAALIILGCIIYSISGPPLRGHEPIIARLFEKGGWFELMKMLHLVGGGA